MLGAAIVAAGALGTAGCSSSTSPSSSSSSPSAPSSSGTGLTAKQIVAGARLKHTYQPGGKGGAKTEALSDPDDITAVGGNLYTGFQNGVGPQGQAAPDGNLDSTVVEFTPSGSVVKQWDVRGRVDGLGTDTATGQVIATANEDANSSLYAISPSASAATHYAYNKPLPHDGGTDSVVSYGGRLLISASAPGTTGKAPASAPAVYAVTLDSATRTADVASFFPDDAPVTAVNGPHAGKKITLALTDPDSSEVVPAGSPSFAGDFMLDGQADQELVFAGRSGVSGPLSALKIPQSVDDSAWATSASGTLFTSDQTSDTIDAITGPFTPGTVYSAVTPCDEANAPSTCPAPGFPANSLGTLNLKTGALARVSLSATVNPQGMIFIP